MQQQEQASTEAPAQPQQAQQPEPQQQQQQQNEPSETDAGDVTRDFTTAALGFGKLNEETGKLENGNQQVLHFMV